MLYQLRPSDIFPHRILLARPQDDRTITDLFTSLDGVVGRWLVEEIGNGSYYGDDGKWRACWGCASSIKPLFHIGFKDRNDVLLFQLRW